ncbi:Nucleotide-binding oligomerization domain-containing protein 2 [Holothuria leucospilota]|uniref:Nucleotide-binding oligomerization domain-containing protein 2 n=1 Tax=Holothuria leucospilota TaxID=206669 RepID=A0A9Q1CQB4_HOLLE|nr:Nucleotide-binding oligomerization domain-containing protein 2 [Holothuria leucospilota]
MIFFTFSNVPSLPAHERFREQLRTSYKRLYSAVPPIPFTRDRLHCVERVFVEGGIEVFTSSWEPLNSYKCIFEKEHSKRLIITGEPGYGKSTLVLQLAYDWCERKDISIFKDVDILILLRLRQLRNVKSIYKAIKQFILPTDSSYTEHDIKQMLKKSSSVVVILEGFDEYPHKDKTRGYDVINIMTLHMFKKFEVIVTSRDLPKRMSKVFTNIRLTGFDDKTQDEYIRKAVSGNDFEAAKRIKERLQKNPVLGDLCQVPLFFVMYAHMGNENEEQQTFKTVTSFFHYMIECFHSHMRIKMEDRNVRKEYLYEERHHKLDQMAFNGLIKKKKQITWPKEEVNELLGTEFVDKYLRIGILVEEEFLGDVGKEDGSPSSEYKREVRFYHKIFCEWYAAHYLAKYAFGKKLGELRKDLCYMDPYDLQYLYRFACGLEHESGGNIIDYVMERGGSQFALLCILEQGGEIDNILRTVKDLCSNELEFDVEQSKLLQRSLIQLLGLASSHKVSFGTFLSCMQTFRGNGGTLRAQVKTEEQNAYGEVRRKFLSHHITYSIGMMQNFAN